MFTLPAHHPSTLLTVLKVGVGFLDINDVNDTGQRFFEQVSTESFRIVITERICLIL